MKKRKNKKTKKSVVSVKAYTRSFPNGGTKRVARRSKTSGALLAGAAIVGALILFKRSKKEETTA